MAHIVINDTTPLDSYTATGGQTEFTVTFPFFTDASLKVYLTPNGQTADDATDILTLTTDYTVTGAGNVEGATKKITLTAGSYPSGATAGDTVVIRRDEPIARTSDLAAQGDFSSETYNDEQDIVIMILQQLEETLGRALVGEVTGGPYDAGSRIIENLSDPANGQDAATKAWTAAQILAASGIGTPSIAGTNVSYDNTSSGLTATEAQAAIDEVEARLDTAETNITSNDGELTQLQNGSTLVVSAGGTANALTADFTTDVTLSDGQRILVKATAAITSVTPTLATDGNTARTILRGDGTALHIGDIVSGHYCEFVYASSGPNWLLVNPANNSGKVLLETITASNQANVEFSSNINSKYNRYRIEIDNLVPATNSQDVYIRSGVGSADSGASDYNNQGLRVANGSSGVITALSTAIEMFDSASIDNTAANGGVSGFVEIINPSDASVYTHFSYEVQATTTSTSGVFYGSGRGVRTAAQADDLVQFLMSSGNITSGEFRLYGLV